MNNFGTKRKSTDIVLRAFSNSSILTQKELVDSTGLSKRTVKYAIRSLISSNFILENKNFNDMRKKNYILRGESSD